MVEKRDILRGNPLMLGLPAELVEALLARCKLRQLGDGDYLYKQGDAGEAMYGVLSGRLCLDHSSRRGRELLVMMAEPGDWIGEVSLFAGGPRGHDAVSRGSSQLLSIAKSDLDELLRRRPELYRYFLPMLCRKLRLALAYVESAALQPLASRLAHRLLDLGRFYGCNEQGEIAVHLPQGELAKMLGVSRQAVSRELKRLEKSAVIGLAYGRLRILDECALRREAIGA